MTDLMSIAPAWLQTILTCTAVVGTIIVALTGGRLVLRKSSRLGTTLEARWNGVFVLSRSVRSAFRRSSLSLDAKT